MRQRRTAARSVAGGWRLTMRRDYGGYPQPPFRVYASLNLSYGSGDGYLAAPGIETEEFRLFVSEDGVQYIDYNGPKEVTGLTNANVELLPFDEIKTRIANALLACFPYEKYVPNSAADTRPVEVEIFQIYLTTYPLHVKNDSDYDEIPCWIVVFDWLSYNANPDWTWDDIKSGRDVPGHGDCLILNAIDGSIVHPDAGY